MIMPRGQQLLLPVNPTFIVFSVAVAFVLSLLPWSGYVWMPDLLMLVLAFWALHHPNRMPMSVGFCWGWQWMCSRLLFWVSMRSLMCW